MRTQLDRKFSEAETAVAALAADPFLTMSQRHALRGALGTIQGVALVRRHALLRLVPCGMIPPVDCRERQLPAGDRDGGRDDAA
ncbi:hypothetical protein DesfrDRAFT_0183 [Solidesulfovibrio fructosivorans JJ]]|uniref:Uncharacterized protein n=1 Tax=Solidesulfovibrio fructosivorans JJ] TaxID=596151 RepID=E1JRD4_SOLFR|nr:hypothetical protein [Solidesulfovibrio fructosivorans]EFL53135.1 hypothetical protein DesfrDRAFT_0183 [Solidesulfovibrio fructosivorans JJ]]